MSKPINKNLLMNHLDEFYDRMLNATKKDPESVSYARTEGFKACIDYIKVLYQSELIQEK